MSKLPLPGASDPDAFTAVFSEIRPDPVLEAYCAYANAPTRVGRPSDADEMRFALREIHDRLMRYERPTEHQLKIGPVNYYPNTGTVHIDGVKGSKKGLSPDHAWDLILKHYK